MERSEQAFRSGSTRSAGTLRTLEQAVALNPKSAKAWGLIAHLKATQADGAPPESAAAIVAEAEQAVRRALAIDPNEPNALVAQARIQGSMDGWAKYDQRLRRALTIDPNNARAMSALAAVLQAAGLTQESRGWNRRLIALEPMNPGHNFRKALQLWILGRVAESYKVIDRAIDLWPKDNGVWNARLLILAFTDRPKAALAMLDGDPEMLGPPAAVAVWRTSLEALDDRSPVKIAEARDACTAAAGSAPGLAAHGAMILAALGETDAAFKITDGFLLSRGDIVVRPPAGSRGGWLNSPGWKWTQWLVTPPASGLRADPRFRALCDGIGLSEYWRVRGVRPDYLTLRG
jgi:tetratricopeptide (TPR) repeat protein